VLRRGDPNIFLRVGNGGSGTEKKLFFIVFLILLGMYFFTASTPNTVSLGGINL